MKLYQIVLFCCGVFVFILAGCSMTPENIRQGESNSGTVNLHGEPFDIATCTATRVQETTLGNLTIHGDRQSKKIEMVPTSDLGYVGGYVIDLVSENEVTHAKYYVISWAPNVQMSLEKMRAVLQGCSSES